MTLLLAAKPFKKWNFFELTAGSTIELTVRYALLAGIAWLLCYVIFKRKWFARKIIAKFPKGREVWREIGYSAMSMVVFAMVGALTIIASRHGYTQIYRKISDHSMLWFVLSIVIAIFIHDAWFYWTHRLMHHRKLFKVFHRVHHLSHNPTPWAAYAFSPLEAAVQAAIFPIVVTVMPMHLYAFGIFMLWQIAYNIVGHSGYEVHPRWLMNTPLKYLMNTPTNHVMHHESMRGNYGLYFNFWDRLMGTNHANYEERFRQVTSPKGTPKPASSTDETAGQREGADEGSRVPS
ncbi:sterol desaturase family protein [Roseimicrobium sp. ORNL1]|uniref:sterol desaturase family protein n=1 Tax=Roseimicrobium sp. ORNL1 TaxID=2711231 RepID=UPI0013E1F06A|nr:sterol desaturase family protein [Roseimicrobium sp. ORNL1]QIF02724.1 sterol desaturase family protein [Roseimicrobium sp. ORNL1]